MGKDEGVDGGRSCAVCGAKGMRAFTGETLQISRGDQIVEVPGLAGWACLTCAEVEFDDASAQAYAAAGDALVLAQPATAEPITIHEDQRWYMMAATPPSLLENLEAHKRRGFDPNRVFFPLAQLRLSTEPEPQALVVAQRFASGQQPDGKVLAMLLHDSWRVALHRKQPDGIMVLPPKMSIGEGLNEKAGTDPEPGMSDPEFVSPSDAARQVGSLLTEARLMSPPNAPWPQIAALGQRLDRPGYLDSGMTADLLFLAHVVAPIIAGEMWPEWESRRGHVLTASEAYAPTDPRAVFTQEECTRLEISLYTDGESGTGLTIRSAHRQFRAIRLVDLGMEPGTKSFPWDLNAAPNWEGPEGVLVPFCDAPFLLASARVPDRMSLAALGADVEPATLDMMHLITQVFSDVHGIIPQITEAINRGVTLQLATERACGAHPEIKQVLSPRDLQWLVAAVLGLIRDAGLLWPSWFAEVAVGKSQQMGMGRAPEGEA